MSAGLKKRLSKASASRHDSGALFGAVRASHRDVALAVLIAHVNAPWVKAHFTVLHKAPVNVGSTYPSTGSPQYGHSTTNSSCMADGTPIETWGSGFGVRLPCMTPRVPVIQAAAG